MRIHLLAIGLSLLAVSGLIAQLPELPPDPQPPAAATDDASRDPLGETSTQSTPKRELQVISQGTFGFTQVDPNITATLGTSDALSFFTVYALDGTPRFAVRGDGYVGIGTRSPDDVLNVFRDTTGNLGIRVNNPNAAGTTLLRFFEGTTYKAHIASVNSATTGANGGPNALHIWNRMNAPSLFATNNIERMRIHGEGNVAIGNTQDVGAKLFVWDTNDNGIGLYTVKQPVVEADVIQSDTGAYALLVEDVVSGVTNGGTLIGSRVKTQVKGGGTVTKAIGHVAETSTVTGSTATITQAYGSQIHVLAPTGTITNGYALYLGDVQATTKSFAVYQVGATDANYFAGQVRLGSETVTAGRETVKLHVAGNAHFTGTVSGGNIQATYQDVAEWVPATEDLAPGTVVVLNTERNNEVAASVSPYDTRVAGVVSAQPGLSLGVAGEGKEQIATTGRVKVRVDARTKPIAIGDLLVTGELPGTAMRSDAVDIGGRKFHQPGTIIGKALEPLREGVGEILVLLSMQ